MVKVLLSAGFNVNVHEGCGATPLVLAVLTKDVEMCTLLINICAEYRADFFVKGPSPVKIASVLQLQVTLCSSKKLIMMNISMKSHFAFTREIPERQTRNSCNSDFDKSVGTFVYNRRKVKPALFAGDQLTCKKYTKCQAEVQTCIWVDVRSSRRHAYHGLPV